MIEKTRTKKAKTYAKCSEVGWTSFNSKKFVYKHTEVEDELVNPILNYRHTAQSPVELLQIFLDFFTPELIAQIRDSLYTSDAYWNRVDEKGGRARNNDIDIYKVMAIKIRIFGLHVVPSEHKKPKGRKRDRPLLKAVKKAKKHFEDYYDHIPVKLQDDNRICRLLTHFLITHDHFELLSNNFAAALKSLGDYVAGDEKLLQFYGDAGDIVKCPGKPDRIGLWFFQLVAKLSNGQCFLFDTSLKRAHGGTTITMLDVVERWAKVCIAKGPPHLILAFDSYYTSNDVRQYLASVRNRLRYVASLNPARFKDLTTIARQNMLSTEMAVTKPGEWYGMFNENTNESFIFCWDEDRGVGKKYCLSNAVNQITRRGTSSAGTQLRGAYDIYKVCFSLCDKYNRALHDRKWPHKHGGRNVAGEWGHQDNYAWSCLLQNVFNLYNDARKVNILDYSFQDYCLTLADNLFEYALHLA